MTCSWRFTAYDVASTRSITMKANNYYLLYLCNALCASDNTRLCMLIAKSSENSFRNASVRKTRATSIESPQFDIFVEICYEIKPNLFFSNRYLSFFLRSRCNVCFVTTKVQWFLLDECQKIPSTFNIFVIFHFFERSEWLVTYSAKCVQPGSLIPLARCLDNLRINSFISCL